MSPLLQQKRTDIAEIFVLRKEVAPLHLTKKSGEVKRKGIFFEENKTSEERERTTL
jgi:hypothetical protein